MVSDTIFPAMPDASRWLEFVRLAAFIRDAKGLLDEDDVARLEHELMENPTAGAVIEGTGGLRKFRFAVGNKGKRGGTRIVYYHRSKKGRVYLITIYAKGVKDSLTKAEKNELKKLTAILDGEA
jgi:hypothetical protein